MDTEALKKSLLTKFVEVTQDRLQEIQLGVLELEKPEADRAVEAVARELHTMKGEARMLGLAAIVGGTSLTGGRGTFVGTVLGAVLLTEVLNAVTFLGLTQTYQYMFQGILIVVAALAYTALRRRRAH